MPTTSWWHNSTNQQFNFPRPLIHTERDEKGKMKKEKGEGEKAAGASIRPDESELLGNRLLPAWPQTAKLKSPPLRGATGGKTMPQTTELAHKSALFCTINS